MIMTRVMKVIYDNTDQKDTTRLGEVWEWSTKVTVTRSYQDDDDHDNSDHHDDHEKDSADDEENKTQGGKLHAKQHL